MITSNELKNSFCIDIETCRIFKTLDDLKQHDERLYEIWTKQSRKHRVAKPEMTEEEIYLNFAALHPEFSKIIAVSMGTFDYNEDRKFTPKLGAVASDNEKSILTKINASVQKILESKPSLKLLGHNVRDFDIPFIITRMMYNGIAPNQLFYKFATGKPWEVPVIDTMLLFRMTRNEYISLETACIMMNIESPKTDFTGADIADYYFSDVDLTTKLQKIKDYCTKDVESTMLLANKIREVWGF